MTTWILVLRSLRFHARAHAGVLLGAAIGTAALVGALLVGDSVRESLLRKQLQRIAGFDYALSPGDRFFQASLAERMRASANHSSATIKFSAAVLLLPGVTTSGEGGGRANQTQVLGVDRNFLTATGLGSAVEGELKPDEALLNPELAQQLGVSPGGEILLRVRKPNALSGDVSLTTRENSGATLRLKMRGLAPPRSGGDFSLQRHQLPPMNLFVDREALAKAAGVAGQANVLLVAKTPGLSPETAAFSLAEDLRKSWDLADASLEIRELPDGGVELRSPRVFLDPPVIEAATSAASHRAVLTYLANTLVKDGAQTPYSFVTAAGPPYTPEDMGDNEILVSRWLAEDLGLSLGDAVSLTYFLPESGAKLLESTNRFVVRGIVPAEMPWQDRTLMPDFPGLEKAETTSDWDFGFELVHDIRQKDEDYWKEYRGTPKAFVTLTAGTKLWGNRFGNLTAVRYPAGSVSIEVARSNVLSRLDPATLGLRFEPIRYLALQSAAQSQDFGQLFLGFSFFLVIAALLLMAMLFRLGLERRATETGTFLALGFPPQHVRRLLLLEGTVLAFLGGLVGVGLGLLYAIVMLGGLTGIWRDAVGTSSLEFHAHPQTLVIGIFASTLVAVLTIWLVLRKQAKQPARELLSLGNSGFEAGKGGRGKWVAVVAAFGAFLILGLVFAKGDRANAGAFFGAGALLLLAGLAAASAWLGWLASPRETATLTGSGLALRGCARSRNRSISTMALLASGCFVVVAVGAFRLDAGRESGKTSGTGGFALLGESTAPIYQDLNSKAGREYFALDADDLRTVNVVPLRVRQGDDASCLNLARAQRPRLLGVDPSLLEGRFLFVAAAKGLDRSRGWKLLRRDGGSANPDLIPAIGDAASIQWALGKKVGDTVDYVDEHGRRFQVRIVAAVGNSILQGSLLIDEQEFVRKFPNEGGYRTFLLEMPESEREKVSAGLSRALGDVGLELTPTKSRLAAFNAVQNTYLGTFQVLGGLGLLLGSAGLGILVLRNVLERRGELGVFTAMGFTRGHLTRLVLGEHALLLAAGLVLGVIAALIAVLPSWITPGTQAPVLSLSLTLAAVLLNGLFWAWVATRLALRGELLAALRNE